MSTRKLPGPQVLATPVRVPIPNEMRQWAAGSNKAAETPRKSQFGDVDPFEQGRKVAAPSQNRGLPGFVNAFDTSSPIRQSQKPKEKRKEVAREQDVFAAPLSPPSSPPRANIRFTQPPDQPPEDLAVPSSSPPAIEPNQRPLQHNALTQEAEVNTLTSSLENASLQEEFSQVEPPDWQATVRAILYSE